MTFLVESPLRRLVPALLLALVVLGAAAAVVDDTGDGVLGFLTGALVAVLAGRLLLEPLQRRARARSDEQVLDGLEPLRGGQRQPLRDPDGGRGGTGAGGRAVDGPDDGRGDGSDGSR